MNSTIDTIKRTGMTGRTTTLKRLAMYLGILTVSAAARAASGTPGRVALPGSVPVQAVASAVDLGALQAGEALKLAFALPWRDPSGLDDLLGRLYDPADPHYGRYLTPGSFADRFGPDPADVQIVADYARGQALTVDSVSPNRLLIDLSGDAASFGRALGVPIHRYRAPNGDLFLAPTGDPLLPPTVASRLLGVVGFGDHTMRPLADPAATGSGPRGEFTPSDIRHGYQLTDVTADGAGQTLGLVEFDGYHASDVSAYEQHFGLPAVPLQNVLIDGFSGAVHDPGGAAEAALDLEMMTSVASGISRILVYEIQNGDNPIDLFNRIATDGLAGAVSVSWGLNESASANADLRAENAVFQQMAGQGQSFFSAAGDNGAFDNGRTLSVDDPASQPYVCGVGGTTLTLQSDGSYSRETTWNVLRTSNPGAGGGGVSGFWTLPAWQQGAIPAGSRGSSTMRNVPDVSLNAGSAYTIYATGRWVGVGGTSAGSPLWAAFTALVNQQRATNTLPSIGFINPALYRIGASPRSAADFHDIADGSTNGYYPAAAGYDDATGWGSFNAPALLADLSAPPSAPMALAGDLNGDGKVDLKDVTLSLQIAVGVLWASAAQSAAGDVNKDGKLDLNDSTLILAAAINGTAL